METQGLLFNLTMGFVWIYSGMILSFTKNKLFLQLKPYRIAKKYMVSFIIFVGIITIATSVSKNIFGENLEFLAVFSLFNKLVAVVLLLSSLISLFDYGKPEKQKIVQSFIPILILILFYFISRLFFEEPKVCSFIELLTEMCSSPPLAIKFLIQLSIILGTIMAICKYYKYKRKYLFSLNISFLGSEIDRIKWIDRMFILLISMAILWILDYIISWEGYVYIHGTLATSGMIYYTISFINYQHIDWPIFSVSTVNSEDAVDECKSEVQEIMKSELKSELPNDDRFKYIDEVHYSAKKAVEKWVNNPEKPYLKVGITLKEVALGIGMSRRKLSDFIKFEYNSNFNTWINTLRIKEVERMLMEEDKNFSLSYLADCTGFSDLAGMSKTFKKIIGVTPSQYRKMLVKKLISEEMVIEEG